MHEMSLAESVLDIIEEAALTQGFSRVNGVILEIGQLAAVEVDAMRFCFEAVMQGTLAEGARLDIVEVAGSGCCAQCGAIVPMRERLDLCPHCGGVQLTPTTGVEMRVKELEVE